MLDNIVKGAIMRLILNVLFPLITINLIHPFWINSAIFFFDGADATFLQPGEGSTIYYHLLDKTNDTISYMIMICILLIKGKDWMKSYIPIILLLFVHRLYGTVQFIRTKDINYLWSFPQVVQETIIGLWLWDYLNLDPNDFIYYFILMCFVKIRQERKIHRKFYQ
jgi:hypothetical protein